MTKRGNKPQTCNARISAMRSFLKFASRKDAKVETYFVQSKGVEKLKTIKPSVSGLSDNAINALFSVIDCSTDTGLRDHLLCRTLLVRCNI